LKNIDKEKAKKAERAKTLVKINTLKQLAVKGKLSQAILWIEDFLENDKLVVFTYYKNTADELGKKFSKNSVKIVGGMTDKQREKAEKSFWNDENTNLLIGNIEAAGTGMNLQVSSNIAFLEYPWSPGLFRQCEDRCHRIGQKNAVTIWNLLAQSTIEANIVHKLEEKAKVISEVIDGDETEGGGIFNELIDQIYQEI
jgi:SNF2 family DNA or RNA helicase